MRLLDKKIHLHAGWGFISKRRLPNVCTNQNKRLVWALWVKVQHYIYIKGRAFKRYHRSVKLTDSECVMCLFVNTWSVQGIPKVNELVFSLQSCISVKFSNISKPFGSFESSFSFVQNRAQNLKIAQPVPKFWSKCQRDKTFGPPSLWNDVSCECAQWRPFVTSLRANYY